MLRRIQIVPILLSIMMLPLTPAAAQSSKSKAASTSKPSSGKNASTAEKSPSRAKSSATTTKKAAASEKGKSAGKSSPPKSTTTAQSASRSSPTAKKPGASAPAKPGSATSKAAAPAKPDTRAAAGAARKPAAAPPPVTPVSPDAGRPTLLASADAAYDRGNHGEALKLYRQAIAEKVVSPEDRPGVDYRVSRSLASTGQYAEAIAEALRVATTRRGTLWEARAKLALMHFYVDAPHEGWKVGNRYIRGGERPRTPEGVEAEALDFTQEDLRKAESYGNEARQVYAAVAKDAALLDEALSHTLDLARVVSSTQLPRWMERGEWPAASDPVWQIDPKADYDPNWAPPKKILYLFQYAEQIAPTARKAQVRLASVAWLRDYHQLAAARHRTGAYPYSERAVADAVTALAESYPGQTASEQARLLLGDWLMADGRHGEALAAYQALARSAPKSRWGQSAQAAAARLSQAELELRAPAVQRPGQPVQLWVKARNAGEVRFTARRLRLEQVMREARVLLRADAGVDDLLARLGGARGIERFCEGDPIEWNTVFSEPGKQETVTREVEAPLRDLGAYLIETEAGSARAAAVVVISDLAVVQIADSSRTLALVVDAETGRPEPQASVLIRELYTDAKGEKAVSAVTRVSDADGLAEKPHSPRREHSEDVLSFAWKDQRYALSASAWKLLSHRGASASAAHVETDRAQYQPNDKVRYRILTAGREGERWKPLSGSKLRLRITAPNGRAVVNREVAITEWGTAHGEYELPEKAATGRYEVVVSRGAGSGAEALGTGSFFVGVEAVPAVQVAVTPLPAEDDAEPRVRISVRKADGTPAPETVVRYTVRGIAGTVLAGGASGTPVTTGSATTDGQGIAVVALRDLDASAAGGIQRYQVLARAEDALGRTATGTAHVEVRSAPVHVTLQTDRGFYEPDQSVSVTARARDAAGKAVALRGRLRVVRIVADSDKLREEEIRSIALRADAGELSWKADRAGRYEVRLEARDEAGRNLSARATVWVAGPEARMGVPPGRDVYLTPERSVYQPGEIARVLVVARDTGYSWLETQEAGAQVLSGKVRRELDAVSVLEIPIPGDAVGGMSLALTGVRGGELIRRVAPLVAAGDASRLRVEVASDRPFYRPGDRATLRIRTLGPDGRPVSARVSLAIVSGAGSDEAGRGTGSPFQLRPRVATLRAQDSSGTRFQSWMASQAELPNAERPQIDPWSGLGLLNAATLRNAVRLGQPGNASAEPVSDMRPASVSPASNAGAAASESMMLVSAVAPETVEALPLAAVREPEAEVLPARAGGALTSGGGSTVFWAPEVVTDADGSATVDVTLPKEMGHFRVVASGWTADAALAQGTTDLHARKDVVVRLASPQPPADGDQVTVTAFVRNLTERAEQVRVRLTVSGDGPMPQPGLPIGPPEAQPLFVPRADRPRPAEMAGGASDALPDPLRRAVQIPAGGEARVEWTVRLPRNKPAGVRVEATLDSDQDSAEIKLGSEKPSTNEAPSRGGRRSTGTQGTRK